MVTILDILNLFMKSEFKIMKCQRNRFWRSWTFHFSEKFI
jgi:hypothetical protein